MNNIYADGMHRKHSLIELYETISETDLLVLTDNFYQVGISMKTKYIAGTGQGKRSAVTCMKKISKLLDNGGNK